MAFALQQTFYEGVVQVIPVLILVMAVGELRLRAYPRRLSSFFFALFVIAFMVLGELVAFAALGDGRDALIDRAIVVPSLCLGCVLLILQFSEVLRDDAIRQTDPVTSASLFFVACSTAVVVALAGGAMILLRSG